MAGARFSRRARLVSKAEFQRVFDLPIKSADRHFTVLARVNDLGQPRLGLAISKKCARSAVQRNRIKRLIRETFRSRAATLCAVDLVVMGRPTLIETPNAECVAALGKLLDRIEKRCAGC